MYVSMSHNVPTVLGESLQRQQPNILQKRPQLLQQYHQPARTTQLAGLLSGKEDCAFSALTTCTHQVAQCGCTICSYGEQHISPYRATIMMSAAMGMHSRTGDKALRRAMHRLYACRLHSASRCPCTRQAFSKGREDAREREVIAFNLTSWMGTEKPCYLNWPVG